MNSFVLDFREINKTKLPLVGGKGANLGELSGIEGIQVPGGFCITTEAYRRVVEHSNEFDVLLDQLSQLGADDRVEISKISADIRAVIEALPIPEDIDEEITSRLSELGEMNPYAVRSSATAEDLPTASFAGQQDTYLNVIGKPAILQHISRCWASLFTDRAVTYRIQNGFDHSKVYLSVVIQKMVFPQAAGILFTADPITNNRKVTSIDASYGLGEALVSGLVNPDIYKVRDGRIIEKKISVKKLAIYALKEGGTKEQEVDCEHRNTQTLTDEQILRLAETGRKIESYFSCPQDIEWCFSEGKFYIVQSRPITTLYPAPDTKDGKNRVYFSFGHRQMMTEAMSPLGMSVFEAFFKQISSSLLYEIGGRLYIDASNEIRSPVMRKTFIKGLATVDVLMQNAFTNLIKRKDFVKSLYHTKTPMVESSIWVRWLIETIKDYRKNDPAIAEAFIARNSAMMQELEKQAANISGKELFDFISRSMAQIKDTIFNTYGVVFAGAYASSWINKNLEKWLNEKNAADALAQSVSNNVTSEMGLELLDVADVVRQYPAVIEYFGHAGDDTFFEDLLKLEGGEAAAESIRAYLQKYGMRCSAEIDIARTRWNEKPTLLIPMILSNIKVYGPNAHSVRFEQGLLDAKRREQEILSRLVKLPGGKRKAKKTKKAISVLRNFAGYREYNKYLMIWYDWILKQAFMKEAGALVQNGIIREKDDIFYLTFEEFRNVIETNRADQNVIEKRKADYEVFKKLTPPRVITSDGEIISGEYDTGNVPKGALAGTPVSSGIVEGRARIILNPEDAVIEEGDILVTTFTDPSWTPLFVSIKGLVTEVGGMMTHGAVVAREYGLPAVVGVENAVKLIHNGQKIRVNGTEGYIEIL